MLSSQPARSWHPSGEKHRAVDASSQLMDAHAPLHVGNNYFARFIDPGKVMAVRRKEKTPRYIRHSFETITLDTGPRIPDANGLIASCRDNEFSVGREANTVDERGVSIILLDHFSRIDLKKPNRCIVAGGDNVSTIVRKGQLANWFFALIVIPNLFTRRWIPKLNFSFCG